MLEWMQVCHKHTSWEASLDLPWKWFQLLNSVVQIWDRGISSLSHRSEIHLHETIRKNGCFLRIICGNFVTELNTLDHMKGKGEKMCTLSSCIRQICLFPIVSLLRSFNLFLLRALGIRKRTCCKKIPLYYYPVLTLIILWLSAKFVPKCMHI